MGKPARLCNAATAFTPFDRREGLLSFLIGAHHPFPTAMLKIDEAVSVSVHNRGLTGAVLVLDVFGCLFYAVKGMSCKGSR